MEQRVYCLDPVYNKYSETLILGTMPGAESLLAKTYYANESNHFWDFIYRIFKPDYPAYKPFDFKTSRKDRYELLISNGVALWDIISDCYRKGSNDSKIKDPHFNDIFNLVEKTQINKIICNGGYALKYLIMSKQLQNKTIKIVKVNSTSSLNPNNTFYIFKEWQDLLSGTTRNE